jgi:hypothetical protein
MRSAARKCCRPGSRRASPSRPARRSAGIARASTGTKNKAYSDVLYVEELIGPDTVNTIPPATLDTFRDHGRIRGDTLAEGLDEAGRILDDLAAAGISLDAVTDQLTEEGVQLFTESTDKALDALREKRVIGSWLLDLTAAALARDPRLAAYSGVVADSGEGRWAVMAAIEEAVPAEVLSAALYARFRSRRDHTFAEKILSAMRAGFGGHVEPKQRDR